MFGDLTVYPDTYTGQDAKLSEAMQGAWVAFAKTGSPNGPGLPHWPAFAGGKEAYLEFGDRIEAKESLDTRHLDFMSSFCEGMRAKMVTQSASAGETPGPASPGRSSNR